MLAGYFAIVFLPTFAIGNHDVERQRNGRGQAQNAGVGRAWVQILTVPLTHKVPCHFSVSLPLQWGEAASLGKGGPGDGSLDGCQSAQKSRFPLRGTPGGTNGPEDLVNSSPGARVMKCQSEEDDREGVTTFQEADTLQNF